MDGMMGDQQLVDPSNAPPSPSKPLPAAPACLRMATFLTRPSERSRYGDPTRISLGSSPS